MRFKRFLILFLLAAGAACSGGLPSLPLATPTPVPETAVPAATPAPATVAPIAPETIVLRVWLPARFALAENNPAADVFWAQIQAWQSAHPDVLLDVRVRPEDGAANLLDALSQTRVAAPDNLPDLIVLRRSDMEAAAAAGLLHSLDGMTLALDDADWFPAARDLARVQNTILGLPLAMDTLVLVYRPSVFPEGVQPESWADFAEHHVAVAFAGGSLNAAFPFLMYQSTGALLQNEEGGLGFTEDGLRQVLTFYADGYANGLFGQTLSSYAGEEEAWQNYLRGESQAVVTWLSFYLQEQPSNSAVMPLPGLDGAPHSVADGWVVALAGNAPERQPLAIRLAEYLTAPDFLALWTQQAGYLPPRPTALSAWQDEADLPLFNDLGATTCLLPPQSQRDVLAVRLQQAVMGVIQGGDVDEVLAETLAP